MLIKGCSEASQPISDAEWLQHLCTIAQAACRWVLAPQMTLTNTSMASPASLLLLTLPELRVQMGVDDRELAWLADRVRQIRAEQQLDLPGSAAPKWPVSNCKLTMACIKRHLSATNLAHSA